MPRAFEPLPSNFILSDDATKVKCTICAPHNPVPEKQWMLRQSHRAHSQSVAHQTNLNRPSGSPFDAQVLAAAAAVDADAAAEENMFESLETVGIQMHRHLVNNSLQVSAAEQEMWDDYSTNGANFDIAEDPSETAEAASRRQFECEVNEFGIWNAKADGELFGLGESADIDQMDGNPEEDELLAELMQNACVDEPDLENIIGGNSGTHDIDHDPKSTEWYPYDSKMMFLLDTLDNMPRLRISDSLMKVFLWILKEGGASDVPSFDYLRKVQKRLRESCGVRSKECKSAQGNVFYINDPRDIIAQDWANPLVRKHIHVYPEITDGPISEIWHAEKWRKGMDLDCLSPMWDAGDRHYYVNELCCLKDGRFVIPVRWLAKTHADGSKSHYADAFQVTFDEMSVATVQDNNVILVATNELEHNFYDLEHETLIPKWSGQTVEAGHPSRMPNPDRKLAGGDPLYVSLVDGFGDDVSGNRTKSWNKHWNMYMIHRNLPRKLLNQEFHVHFISTSPHASISEQFVDFKRIIENTHKEPVKTHDALTGQSVRFKIFQISGAADNPMASEISGHIGGQGNFYCRKCHVGGSDLEKETDNGYCSLFMPGSPRSKIETLTEVKAQVNIACLGIAQHVKDRQTATGIKDAYTQYWIDDLIKRARTMQENEPNRSSASIQAELFEWAEKNRDRIYSGFLTLKGFDPTRDTPVEILHTILLGVVKYVWHDTHTSWSPSQKKTFALRLQSTDTSGLTVHAIRSNYIMQYANSLIGRQLKTVAQTSVFHIYDLVDKNHLSLWKAMGELTALLWFPEIPDTDTYLVDITVAVGNVLDLFAVISPKKILDKIKLHLLTHIREDIVRFGPLVGVATEIFECFNAVFRMCSILSNHRAPSRDIAYQLADQEGMKHRLTSGFWPSPKDNSTWECAGSAVRDFLRQKPLLQKLYGWTDPAPLIPGTFKLAPFLRRFHGQATRTRRFIIFCDSQASKAVNAGSYDLSSEWNPCVYTIAASEDKCSIGSWVFAKSPIDGKTVVGQIIEILARARSAIVSLDIYQVASTRHEIFGMPTLSCRYDETSILILPAIDILFDFNVQHDCGFAKCSASGIRPRVQERTTSSVTEEFIIHKPIRRYIINTHAFHNAHLLRQVLPRSLVAPVALFEDRNLNHKELATQLRRSQGARREQLKTQREAKKAATEANGAAPGSKKRKTRT